MPVFQKADPELVTTDPYRGIRHPIYSGIIILAMLGAYFVYSAIAEERFMAGFAASLRPQFWARMEQIQARPQSTDYSQEC
jgi:protein-S-isoprenylcysteine O-methyltransferase Ste14